MTYQQTIDSVTACSKLDDKRKIFNASEYRSEYETIHGKKRKMAVADITQFIDWLQGKIDVDTIVASKPSKIFPNRLRVARKVFVPKFVLACPIACLRLDFVEYVAPIAIAIESVSTARKQAPKRAKIDRVVDTEYTFKSIALLVGRAVNSVIQKCKPFIITDDLSAENKRDSPVAKMLDAMGYPRNIRHNWKKIGIPKDAALAIIATYAK